MQFKPAQLQELAAAARQRVIDLVQHPDQLEALAEAYGQKVIDAVTAGVLVSRLKPGAPTKYPRMARVFTVVRVTSMVADIANKPVSGGIRTLRRLAGTSIGLLIHHKVTGKPSRFVLSAATVLLLAVVERQAQAWAAANEQLQAIEAQGLHSRRVVSIAVAKADFTADEGWDRATQRTRSTDEG
jgi:hypothetical protein